MEGKNFCEEEFINYNNMNEYNQHAIHVHLHIEKRNNRASITSITGLPLTLDSKSFSRELAKLCSCRVFGSLDALCLQGDHRKKIAEHLIKSKICNVNQITIHGY